MKLHILAITAHPDDVELGCAGTLIKHARKGQAVGALELTRGELGTRGTPEMRLQEAEAAAKVLGLSVRENVGFRDGFFRNDEEHQLVLARYIRRYQPDIVLTNALSDRHPDHGRAAQLVIDACFLSGLRMIDTEWEGEKQVAWRPGRVYHMIQNRQMEPTMVVDTTDTFAQKIEALQCFRSQFHNPDSTEPMTYIASLDFFKLIEYRDAVNGQRIGVKYGEGFVSENITGISDLDSLIIPKLS